MKWEWRKISVCTSIKSDVNLYESTLIFLSFHIDLPFPNIDPLLFFHLHLHNFDAFQNNVSSTKVWRSCRNHSKTAEARFVALWLATKLHISEHKCSLSYTQFQGRSALLTTRSWPSTRCSSRPQLETWTPTDRAFSRLSRERSGESTTLLFYIRGIPFSPTD